LIDARLTIKPGIDKAGRVGRQANAKILYLRSFRSSISNGSSSPVQLTHKRCGNSRWFEDVAGRRIAAAAETLPPEVVAVAQERGQARDTAATVAELLAAFGHTGD
jgi:hypothetical protein